MAGKRALIPLLAACAHVVPVDYAETPRLPAPVAGTYARVVADPPDPAVAALLAGRAWDASVGGAAAGVALWAADVGCDAPVPRWRAQEAAWAAGYPYPIDDVSCWASAVGAPPPGDLAAWLSTVPATADVGLVRARGANRDVWVAVVGRPTLPLGVLPRVPAAGGRVAISASAGASMTVSDPAGRATVLPLDQDRIVAVGVPGEWLFEVTDASGVSLARFPVYAGMAPPDAPLFPSADDSLDQRLSEVVAAYDLPAWTRDDLLDAAARSMVRDGASPDAVAASLRAQGTRAVWCSAATRADCLAGLVWSAQGREVLLDRHFTAYGVAESAADGRVTVAVVLAEP